MAHQIPVYQPKSLKKSKAQAELAALNADLIVVVAYGLLLPQAVLDIPEVVMVHAISGPEDFMLVVVAKDLDSYSHLLQHKLHRLPGVRRVHTHFSLQDFKGQVSNLPVPSA